MIFNKWLVLATIGLFALPVSALQVTINSNLTRAIVRDGPVDVDNSFTTAIPLHTTLTASAGSASSTAIVNWSSDATSVRFKVDSTHSIDNTDGDADFAQTVLQAFVFTPDEDTTYTISGSYDTVAPAGLYVLSEVKLLDMGGTVLFRELDSSRNTANESFTVGNGPEGDDLKSRVGPLTGALIGGQDYEFFFGHLIQDALAQNFSASATSTVTLQIGTPVPLPGTLGLLGLAAAGLGFRRTAKVETDP